MRVFTDEYVRAELFAGVFEPGGDVHGVTDHGVSHAGLAADVACHDLTRVITLLHNHRDLWVPL